MSDIERAGGTVSSPHPQEHSQDNEDESAPLLLSTSAESGLPAAHHHLFNGNHDKQSGRSRARAKKFLQSVTGLLMLLVIVVLIIIVPILGIRWLRNQRSQPQERGPAPNPFNLPPPKPGLRNPSYLVRGRHGAVATEAEMCSSIGLDILKEGGKATDAAISSALCSESDFFRPRIPIVNLMTVQQVGIVNSFSSGIGGGGFMVIRPSNNSSPPFSIDFRETSPSGSHPEMYSKPLTTSSKIGGLAIGVPGELRGFEEAYKRFGGGVSWERIFRPNIELAERGWNVTAELDRRLKVGPDRIIVIVLQYTANDY